MANTRAAWEKSLDSASQEASTDGIREDTLLIPASERDLSRHMITAH